jgi:hypothetical protein
VGGLTDMPGLFYDILKGPFHRSLIPKIGLFSGIFQEIYLILA